jgi:hypothetical protein
MCIYLLFKKKLYTLNNEINLQSTINLGGVDKEVNNTVGVTELVIVPTIIISISSLEFLQSC